MRSWCVSTRPARVLGLVLATALSACGGGGGGGGDDTGNAAGTPASAGSGAASALDAGVRPSAEARLFQPSAMVPTMAGVDGPVSACALSSGTLPAGMTLNSDCSITGTPTEAGSFPVFLRVTLDGTSAQIERPTSVLVFGPSLIYALPSGLAVGSTLDASTLNNFWSPTPADRVTYSVEGALPPGLAIDAATGRIHGTATQPGFHEFRIAVRTENASRSFTQIQAFPQFIEVRPARIFYNVATAWVGLPFVTAPVSPDGPANFRYAASDLPKGLAMDPLTGAVTGVARSPQQYASEHMVTVSAPDGSDFTMSTQLRLNVMSPVYILYGSSFRIGEGRPVDVRPTIHNNSQQSLDGVISYRYALAPGSTLPDSVTLDPVSGNITGTVPQYSTIFATVTVTVTVNGVTFEEPLSVFL
jgi:hypothetical protein